MSITLIAGLGLTIVAVATVFSSLFVHRVSPASGTGSTDRSTVQGRVATAIAPRAPSDDVEIRWWQRLRSAAMLLALTVGLGACLAAAIGSFVFVVSLGLS